MDPITTLPATRRLVTGHNERGKAVFEFDEVLTPFNPYPKSGGSEVAADTADTDERPPLGVTLIHRTREYPVKIQGGAEELASENVRRGQGELGIVCQIVDLPPTPRGETGYLHRNQSLDYGVVLKGSMQILLDDGVEQTLTEGDVYVQKWVSYPFLNYVHYRIFCLTSFT
jgi:hypothetical protein